jgi:hypothetical protein
MNMSSNSQIQNVIDSVVDAVAPGELYPAGQLKFSYNGLATPPQRPERKLFGLYSIVEVPPGTWGICYAVNGAPSVFLPGTHWLMNTEGGVSTVQFVDATQRRRELLPISGLTSDGWRVTLQAVLIYEVADPVQAARTTAAMATLEAAGRAAILAQIEAMTHQALIGSLWTAGVRNTEDRPVAVQNESLEAPSDSDAAGVTGLRFVEDRILTRLRERPSLSGLRVVEVAIIEREGDERLVEIVRTAEIERTKVIEEQQTETERVELSRIQLEAEAQTAATARTVALIQAETRSQLAAIEEQLKIQAAQTEAQVEEIRQVQEARESERKRLAEEWRTAKQLDLTAMEYQHEETMAVIQGTAQVTAEAARAGTLESTENSFWPRPADSRVVGQGLQVLKGFREQIAPPVTRFLPRPDGAADGRNRLRAESLRLDRIRGVGHEMVIRQGQLAAARVWFTGDAPTALRGVMLEISCPETYPFDAPLVIIHGSDLRPEQRLASWEPELFLADLVRELMLELARPESSAPEDAGLEEE